MKISDDYMEKLTGEGEVKIVRKELVRRGCDYCGEPASHKNTYLRPSARTNPASSAYGRDDCSWCSDHDDFVCPACHAADREENVPEGYRWCSTFLADRFPHMFLRWEETDITEQSEATE